MARLATSPSLRAVAAQNAGPRDRRCAVLLVTRRVLRPELLGVG
jgi:hypothetical protein